MIQKRYGALRVIATLFKILGILIILFAILTGLATFVGVSGFGRGLNPSGVAPIPFGAVGGLIGAFLVFLIGLFYGIFIYALGDIIYLFLAVEENTRLTSTLLQQGVRPTTTALPPTPPTPPRPPALPEQQR